jgi:hypothetical protein
MFCKPAMKMIMLKPKFFHTAIKMIAGIAQTGSPSQSMGAMPNQLRP